MASLSTGSDGLHKVYFMGGNGKRQCLYCGRIPKKTAEGIERCMADLERCRASGSIPGPATTIWLADISAEWHAKLVKHGLTTPRAGVVADSPTVLTFDELIDRYKSRPKWAEKQQSTKVANEFSFGHLRVYFGKDRDIVTITEADAEDLVGYLTADKPKGAGLAEATGAKIVDIASMLMGFAVKSRVITTGNPFHGVRRGSYVTARRAFVDADVSRRVIAPARAWRRNSSWLCAAGAV